MCTLSSTQHRRNSTRQIVAGTVLALLLASQTSASAQAGSPPANKPVVAPKQVGSWTVMGWSDGYCVAERPLPGAAGGGATLHLVFARLRGGYRIGLASAEWELKPQTTFPVELIAHPVFRGDANAVAVQPRLVIIDLGADGKFIKKLATTAMIEVKAAQATFKLPLDGFGEALTEVDSCFGALNLPGLNPFAAPQPAPTQPAAPPAPAAKPTAAAPDGATPVESAPVKTATVKIAPPPTPLVASPAAVSLDDELVEERAFLTVQSDKGPYRLETLVVRPAKFDGRLPIALITHGKGRTAAENQGLRADVMVPQARDLAARGWLAVVVVRRGYGRSDGVPGVSRGATYMTCENSDLVRGFDTEAEDLDAALKAIAARPDADGSRVIAIGESLGGSAVLAFAARQSAGLLGVVNVSGGVWRAKVDGSLCDHADLVAAMATLGARTRVPTLWLYAENDSLFPAELVTGMRAAYAEAGGRAELLMLPPVLHDGHRLFVDFRGRVKWLRALDRFLQAHRMPNANVARVDKFMSATRLATSTRPLVQDYLSAPMPKVLVATASGAGVQWVANPVDIDGARKRILANCREKSGAECTVTMENNALARPVVTGAIAPEMSEH